MLITKKFKVFDSNQNEQGSGTAVTKLRINIIQSEILNVKL